MDKSVKINYCIIAVAIAIVQLIDADSIPEMDGINARDCDYNFQDIILTQQSNKILNTTNIINETIEVQFDIKLSNPCNSLCNILYIGNNDKIQHPSLSVNGLTNHIELTINNSHYNITYEIPNANEILPADNQYYNIYLYISPNINILRINYTLVVYNYYDVFSLITNISYYSVYTSDPWHAHINASIANLCIRSNLIVKSHGVMNCGDIIKGELISPSDINYYYFNLSQIQSVLLDACTSWFDTYLYLYHKNNLTILYEQDDDEFCNLQTVMWITSLPADQYILAISGYETFKNHDYGEWEIEIICDKHYNYSYIPLYEWEITWLQAEFECRRRFGTTLATVVTEQDLEEIKTSMPNTKKYVDLWIGLYNNIGRSEWQWIDGTKCNLQNSTSAPCINYDTDWRLDSSDISKYGTYLSWFTTNRETVLRYIGAIDQQTGKNGMICNAPNGKYKFINCENDLNNCWTDMDCCNNSILESDIHFHVYEFQPAIAVWNRKLFIVGLNQVHYTNIDLFSPHIEWNNFMYHNNNQSYNKSITQWYSQYESLLHIYLTNTTHGTLISINLDNYQIESVVSPEIMMDVCVVADQYNVFILSGSTIKIYDISEKTWKESAIFHHVYAACALDQEDNYIYIFAKLEYTLYKYDIHKNVFVVLDIPNLCYTETGRAITERNDKIYLHGCSVGSWETIIYDIKSEKFESYSVNMRNITNINTPYYQTGQLVKFEDNVILLFHVTDTLYPSWGYTAKKNEIKLYYAITDLISINVQQTHTDTESPIWPSDGFYIKYYINDFTDFADMIYNVYITSKNITVNELITLNILNDNCICNETSYKCSNCNQHFDLNKHLSVDKNHINTIQFRFSTTNQNITSIVPEYVTIELQRCNIWFKNEKPSIETVLLKTDDAKIEFSFNLSNNCYTKIGANFTVNITAPLINLHKQLKINVEDKDLIVKTICDKHGRKCHILNSNVFNFVFDISKENKQKPIQVFMKSNTIDMYIKSEELFVVEHEHQETGQIIIGVVVAVIVLAVAIACYLYCRNKKLKMKLAEQKKHKKVIINPMVLVISIGHYIDDPNITGIELHCPDLEGIDRDYENIKGFCRLYKYKIYPKYLKIEWTQDEIVQFLKRKAKDLSHNIKDMTKQNKYDSLFVFISGHGYKNNIITSDYKTISKTAIHRIFSSSLPHIRLLPRVFLFDVCAGSQQRNITSSTDTIDSSQINVDIEDSMSEPAIELEQMIGKDAQKIADDDEVKTSVTQHISGADIDEAAMKNHESVWKNNEKNPDFKLCVVNGANAGFQAKMNLIDGSYLIYELVKRLIKNVSRKNKLFFGDIIGKIQVDLHDKGAQQITSTFHNYTRYLRFEVNNNKFYNQVSVTETHDNLGITEMKEEEPKEMETDNTAKTSEKKPKVKGGKSYTSVPTEEDDLLE
eukprot:510571_1